MTMRQTDQLIVHRPEVHRQVLDPAKKIYRAKRSTAFVGTSIQII